MRLGLFGGSFDPIHLGHLLLAEYCREQCRLDQVWFIPAAVAPHKQRQPFSVAQHRLEMLSLAIAGHAAFEICDLELERGGISYTVDTLQAISDSQREAELFLLMGADTLVDLVNWHRPDDVCSLATPVVVGRPGDAEPDYRGLSGLVSPEQLSYFRQHQVTMPLVELSSREIRRRVAGGESIRYQTPRAVEKYIESHQLYRDVDRRESD